MEVSNALNNLVVGTFEVDFHNKDVLTTAERLPACTSKHLLGSEFSLLHTFDLLNRDHNGWLVREALVVNLILVNEETVLVQHKISLHQSIVFGEELADGTLKDDLAFSIISGWVEFLAFLLSTDLVIRCSSIFRSWEHND